MRPCYASLCSVSIFNFRETWQTFLECFSHHQLVMGFDCWLFVVNAPRISQSSLRSWQYFVIKVLAAQSRSKKKESAAKSPSRSTQYRQLPRLQPIVFCVAMPTHISLGLTMRAVSLFSSRAAALVSRVSRLRCSTLSRACTPLTKYEEKERLLAV